MRYFLVDKVTHLAPGERARGHKTVTLTDEVLHDHFPDYPIFPGALVVESLAQLGGFLIEMSGVEKNERAILAQIEKAKFKSPAGPGDRMDLEVVLSRRMDGAAQIDGEAKVADAIVCTARLTFMLRAIESERVHEQRRWLYAIWTRDLSPLPRIP